MDIKSLDLDTISDWDRVQAVLRDASDNFDMINSRYGMVPANVTPHEVAELLRQSTADAFRIISMLDSLLSAKFILGSRLEEIKGQWQLTLITEQATDSYKRLILTNRSWDERENAAKLNHIEEFRLLLKAQSVYESLTVLVERLKGDQYFIQNYQRVLEQLVRLSQVSAILSDTQ